MPMTRPSHKLTGCLLEPAKGWITITTLNNSVFSSYLYFGKMLLRIKSLADFFLLIRKYINSAHRSRRMGNNVIFLITSSNVIIKQLSKGDMQSITYKTGLNFIRRQRPIQLPVFVTTNQLHTVTSML